VLAESKITKVFLTIYKRDNLDGWAVGCELKKNDEIYFIYSLYLPMSEFKSQRRVLHFIISEVLKEIHDSDELVIFHSSLNLFNVYRELERKAGVFAGGRKVKFKKIPQVPRSVVNLAIGAGDRKESITERL
jgi:hypothetical protein